MPKLESVFSQTSTKVKYVIVRTMSKRNRPDDIFQRVEKTETCWLWKGSRNTYGYGQVRVDGRLRVVHRVVYEILVGPIPPDHEVDHLCFIRNCVNPAHLEPVTRSENIRRMPLQIRKLTHCMYGHEMTEGNFFWSYSGYKKNPMRVCKICKKRWGQESKARRLAGTMYPKLGRPPRSQQPASLSVQKVDPTVLP